MSTSPYSAHANGGLLLAAYALASRRRRLNAVAILNAELALVEGPKARRLHPTKGWRTERRPSANLQAGVVR